MSSTGCKQFKTDMWADYYKLPDNLRIDRHTCNNAGAGWGNMVNDATATTEVVFSKSLEPNHVYHLEPCKS